MRLHGGATARIDVGDVVQDTFIKAFAEKARLLYDPTREYRAFLMSIARRTLVDHLRVAPRELSATDAQLECAVDEDRDPVDSPPWADAQTMLVVEQYTSRLSGPEQGVYVARYVRGHSQEVAAKALGLTRQRVRTLESKIATGLAREIARSSAP